MRIEYLTESAPQALNLTEDEASAVAAAGRRLAGSREYWGRITSGSNREERTVIRCVRLGPGRCSVTVAEAVGIVALPSLQLVVVPKIPPSHFSYLLSRSLALPRLDDHRASAADSPDLWDLVTAWFVTALERLLRRGLVADYEEQRAELPYVRGTVQAMETANAYYQGRASFSSVFDEFGLDSPMNRVLRAAALAAASAPVLKPELRRRARRALTRFINVGELRPGDFHQLPERRSAHYAAALQLARSVLMATGRAIASGSSPAWTFLIRTPELIEEAIRGILRSALHDIVDVRKSRRQLKPSHLTLNPDLAFGHLAIGDVKYSLLTSDWDRTHLYQAVAFATGYGVTHASVFGFASSQIGPPELQVGPVHLRAFTWLANRDVAPSAAEAMLTAEARRWFAAADAGRCPSASATSKHDQSPVID